MKQELIGDRTVQKDTKPIAVLISGLPGCGKSSTVSRFFADELDSKFDTNNFVRIDFDKLRSFHQEYENIIHPNDCAETGSDVESYLELVPWFIEGTNFEQVLFKNNDGLIPEILDRRLSFSMETILDKEGCFGFVQHIRSLGYQVIMVLIHTPLQEAIGRAKERAYRTGRWSSPEYIRSREEGIIEWFPPLANFLVNQCDGDGTVVVYDNSIRDEPATIVYHSKTTTQVDHPSWETISDLYQLAAITNNTLQLDFLHTSRGVRTTNLRLFAETFVKLIFPGDLTGTSFSLAGGCFKSLVTGKLPMDFDIWPHSNASREQLQKMLDEDPRAQFIRDTRFNKQYTVNIPAEDPEATSSSSGSLPMPIERLYVEIVVYSKPTLQEVLNRFDMAISAAGVAFTDGMATDSSVIIHRNFVTSFFVKKPLLIEPMPNVPFLLATAERVVRYCRELGFPYPTEQMDTIQGVFDQQSVETRKSMIKAWQEVSRDADSREIVWQSFKERYPGEWPWDVSI